MTKLRDPERCPSKGCRGPSHVLKKRARKSGVIWRRHRCQRCGVRWSSFQSLFDMADVPDDDIPPEICAEGAGMIRRPMQDRRK